jgi:hypothetical protein
MKNLRLTQNKTTQIDDDVYLWAKDFKWCTAKVKDAFYAVRSTWWEGGWHRSYLHHFVIGRPLNGFIIDHIDGDSLNNQRFNLRIVSYSQNAQNRNCHRHGLLCGADRLPSGRWRARTTRNGKRIHLGVFTTPEEANQVSLGASL